MKSATRPEKSGCGKMSEIRAQLESGSGLVEEAVGAIGAGSLSLTARTSTWKRRREFDKAGGRSGQA